MLRTYELLEHLDLEDSSTTTGDLYRSVASQVNGAIDGISEGVRETVLRVRSNSKGSLVNTTVHARGGYGLPMGNRLLLKRSVGVEGALTQYGWTSTGMIVRTTAMSDRHAAMTNPYPESRREWLTAEGDKFWADVPLTELETDRFQSLLTSAAHLVIAATLVDEVSHDGRPIMTLAPLRSENH